MNVKLEPYMVIHNGMTVKFFKTSVDARHYIDGVLKEYTHLQPRLVYHRIYGDDIDCPYGYNSVVESINIYQYKTLYMECFVTIRKK